MKIPSIKAGLIIALLLAASVFALNWRTEGTEISPNEGEAKTSNSKGFILPSLARTEGLTLNENATEGICGDANRSGVVDLADVIEMLQVAVGFVKPNLSHALLADLNSNIRIDVIDAIVALKHLLNHTVIVDCGPPPPELASFSPPSGSIGTVVSIEGENLRLVSPTPPSIRLAKQGGGSIEAPIANFTSNQIEFVIPPGVDSGNLDLTVGIQTVSSVESLEVLPSSDYLLNVKPAAASLIQGRSTTYAITLSTDNGFSQLAELDVFGLPEGVGAFFQPDFLAAGDTSMLTVLAPEDQPAGTSEIYVTAVANVEGFELDERFDLSLEVVPVTTSFMSRTVVDDNEQTPIEGVEITLLGRDGEGNPTGCTGQTVSDGAGNFAFVDLPEECTGGQLIRYDGTTATSPPGEYAGVDLFYDIVSDQVNESPVLIHLPRIDNSETVMVQQNASEDQVFTFETIPNLTTVVYAGTTFTLLDGTQPDPFPLIAVRVPVDRLPDAMPPDPDNDSPFIVAFQPANATASQPVAVFFPNITDVQPNTAVTLMTLDPTKGVMVPYGTGRVAEDGLQIVPDFDPENPGRRYGLVHFDWHGQQVPPKPPGT